MPASNIDEHTMLISAYREFNARNIDAVLAMLHPTVQWANGMEGGYVYGREAVRDYWTRQWSVVDPHVEPLKIEAGETGRFVVQVHQVVRDLNGVLMLDAIVHHAYRIHNGLIERMDIK